MSQTTTASVRLKNEKKDRLKEVLDALGSSRQEALEEAIDHIIARYEILAEISPKKLESKINNIFNELEKEGCVKSVADIEAVPLRLKIVLLSNFLEQSLEVHEHRTKKIQRELDETYRFTPQLNSLSLNPFEIQELKDKNIAESVEISASQFYESQDEMSLPVKIRYMLEAVDLLLGESKGERFLEVSKKMYGERSPILIEDDEIEINHSQNQEDNTLTVEVKLPFKRAED